MLFLEKKIKILVFVVCILLLLNIITLIYMFLSQRKSHKILASTSFALKRKVGSKIAHINLDEIENNYLLMQQIRKNIERRERINETKMSYLLKKYQYKMEEIDKKKKKLSQEKLKQIEQELVNLKVTYIEFKNTQEQMLKEIEFNDINEVKKKIQDYLIQYNKEKQLDYVFANDVNFIYYKDGINDITQDVIRGLNQAYKKR